MRRSHFSILSILAFTFSLSAALPKAILVNDINDYQDILVLKQTGEVAYIHDDNAKTFKYGMFEGDKNPTELKAWSVYDLFYLDVPATYETALSMIAKKNYESAKKLLEKCGSDKTPSKKLFSATEVYKNYVPHKLFLCALGLGDNKEAIKLYKQIDRNPKSHARVSVLKDVLPILVEEKEGDLALKVADELSKIRLASRELIEVSFSRCLALSLKKRYAESKEVLNELITKYADDNPELKSRAIETQASIFVDHQKNYKGAIDYLHKVKSGNEVFFSAYLYEKLGDCYRAMKKPQDARWNYLNSFLLIESNKVKSENVIAKIQAINKELGDRGGSQGLETLFDKVKSNL
jgi:tetratricopeptide (TPR) repeat protein